MENNNEIKNILIDWLEAWRNTNGIDNGVQLEGEILDKFVLELQTEIVDIVEDFGQNTISDNAKLVLYSGQDYNMVKEFCATSNGEYYMISNTASDILWDNTLRQTVANVIGESSAKDPITARILEGKIYNDDGTWTRVSQYATDSNTYLALDDFISSKVAEAGLERGNIIYMISDTANPNSVGLMTEIPTVFNYKNAGGAGSSNTIEVVTNLIKNEYGTFTYEKVDCSNATVYFTDDGNVKYVDMLESLGSEGTYVGESQFTTTLKEYLNYTSDTDMTSRYADYNNYTTLEKLQAKQFDYEKRLISDMVDRGITSEKGVELLPTDELKTKYSFIDDATDANIIKELQLAEYRNSKYGTGVADSVTLYFDDAGKVVAAGNQNYKTSIESNVKYTTAIEDYLNTSKNFLLDETMESMYKGYKDLSPLEKIQAKQLDYDFRLINLELDKITISDATMNKYLAASKKTAAQLNAVDKQFMKIADSMSGGKDDIAKGLTNFANKCKVLGKVGKVLMTGVDIVGTVAIAAVSIYQAVKLYEAGYESDASAVMAGCAINVVGGIAGGTALTGAISPYLIGFGAAVGGPAGATVGAVVSGIIGYTLAGLAASEVGQYVIERWDDIVANVGDAYNVVTEEIDDLYGGVLAVFDRDADGAYFGGSFRDDHICGGNGDNKIEGFEGDDVMYGLDGKDVMYGGDDNDVIYGESGNDVLYGEAGNDTLIGGAGEDILYGGAGNDTYIWETGCGIDQIFDSSGLNKIVFKGTYPEDLRVMYFNTGEAIIYNKKTKEMLALPEFTLGSDYHNFELEFADGQVMSVDSPLSPFVCNVEGTGQDNTLYAYFENSTLKGMAGNDILVGSSGSDTMSGGEGDDYFEGGEGDDIMYGDEGNDYLKGGEGNDTYVNSVGGGTDVIEDTSGINIIKFTDSAVNKIFNNTDEYCSVKVA